MDPYTEYLRTEMARQERSLLVRQPRPARRAGGPRAHRWRLRPVRR